MPPLPFRPVSLFTRKRLLIAIASLVVLAGAGYAVYRLIDAQGNDTGQPASVPAPAPQVLIERQEPQATEDLGFPAFATKNTTRVAGEDAAGDAAGVALATFPSTGGTEGPAAVSLVADRDWQAGVAASVLAGPPVSAPILVGGAGSLPDLTVKALEALAPEGSPSTDDRQVFAIGDTAMPKGTRAEKVTGSSPAEIANALDELRQKLVGSDPEHILLVSSTNAGFAMPAASWAARSGDPILFMGKDSAPAPTIDALKRHKGVPVYVLGPPSVISDKALGEIRKVAPAVQRVGAEDPVQNAITFARYSSGGFGWDINDPGHGFVIANVDRPLDAAAAAPLSASGDWGPLLVTDEADAVPSDLRGYLLDVKPGYLSDPTRAVYNHVWVIGDQKEISVGFQSQVDDLAELVPVRSDTGTSAPPPESSKKDQRP